jgi:hypothetical protein
MKTINLFLALLFVTSFLMLVSFITANINLLLFAELSFFFFGAILLIINRKQKKQYNAKRF